MSDYRPRTLTEYVQIILARKSLLLLAAGSMFAATIWVIHHIPNSYKSTASIVITDNGEGRDLASGRVAAAVQRLSSGEFLAPIISNYHLYGDEGRSEVSDGALAMMRKDIEVQTQYRGDFPESVSVAYRNPDPAVAKTIADRLVSVFSSMNAAIVDQTNKELASTDQSLTDIESKLRQIGVAKADDEMSRAAANRADSRMESIRARKIAESSSIEDLASKQFELEQQIAEQKREIEQQKKIAKSAPGSDKGSSYGALLVKKAELQGQLQLYATEYTDKNPKVVEAKTQLAALQQEIGKFESQGANAAETDSAASRDLRAMQRDLAKMEIDHDVNQRELDLKRKELGSGPTPIAAAVIPASLGSSSPDAAASEGLKSRYGTLLNRQQALDAGKIETAGLAPGFFQIVDSPAQPTSPVGPNRLKLILLALGISGAFALIVVAALEGPKLSAINSVSDVEYYLGSPVIALIPETFTEVESRRRRRIGLLRGAGALILAAALIPAFVFALNYLQIFQIVASH